MKRKRILCALLFVVLVPFTSGCGKKADTSKSVDQIKTEVQRMSLGDLEANAKVYATEIVSKKSEVDKAADKMKSISPTELFGDKAKGLKDEISKLQSDLSALTQRYEVYAQKYSQMGGDVSKVKIS